MNITGAKNIPPKKMSPIQGHKAQTTGTPTTTPSSPTTVGTGSFTPTSFLTGGTTFSSAGGLSSIGGRTIDYSNYMTQQKRIGQAKDRIYNQWENEFIAKGGKELSQIKAELQAIRQRFPGGTFQYDFDSMQYVGQYQNQTFVASTAEDLAQQVVNFSQSQSGQQEQASLGSSLGSALGGILGNAASSAVSGLISGGTSGAVAGLGNSALGSILGLGGSGEGGGNPLGKLFGGLFG